MIQNIPTTYKDVKYRSRLEARWAVFFDELNIVHRYEHEGFKLVDGEYYLPDFYLPQYDVYCEVKPTWGEVEKNAGTFKKFANIHWLLMLVSEPNMNTTRPYTKRERSNVVPFVNLVKTKYGNYWGSPFDVGSNKDKFIEYNIFKDACEAATKFSFY